MTALPSIPPGTHKREQYKLIADELEKVIGSEYELSANLANFTELLKHTLDLAWVGVYLPDQQGSIVLTACAGGLGISRFSMGEGLVGEAWQDRKPQLKGHDAENAPYKSALAVPCCQGGTLKMIVLLWHHQSLAFDDIDEEKVEHLGRLILMQTLINEAKNRKKGKADLLALSHGGWESDISVEEEIRQLRESRIFTREIDPL